MFTKKKAQGKLGARDANQNKRLVIVNVIEARGILAADKKGTSDSYVVCNLLDLGDREVKTEKCITQPIKGTVNPVFQQTFSFGNTFELDTHAELPTLKFSLFHKGGFAVSETPLGEVLLSLTDIDPEGETTDIWYPLKRVGRMQTVSGELHLRLTFNRPVKIDDDDIEARASQADSMLKEPTELEEEFAPNELVVNVIQAKNLEVMDKSVFGGGSSDPFVRLRVNGFPDQQTGYIQKNIMPVWNEKFTFPGLKSESLSLQVSVFDYNSVQMKKFMGRVTIPLYEFLDKRPKKKWYKLSAKQGNDGKDRGEVELTIVWRYSPEIADKAFQKEQKDQKSVLKGIGRGIGKAGNFITGYVSDEDMDEAEDSGDVVENEAELAETPEEAEKKRVEKEAKMKELADIEVKSGDYTIQVHIIEARDLKAENLDGTSDPVCYVEMFGQKQNTSTKKGCVSAVYDELLIFNFRNLDKDEFKDGVISISVRDSNSIPMAKQTMIGAVAYDATYIYNLNKHHELYRQWVGIVDDEDPDDVGVQGYLKISIQIVGPGDKLKIHNEEEDIAAEAAKEASAGGDIGSMVLTTPAITKEWKFVVVSVYRCEALPVMDGKLGMGVATVKSAGTDSYVQIQFGSTKPIKTKTVTVKGDTRLAINPTFMYELWYPISLPSMTQQIKVSVWDSDFGPSQKSDELIATMSEKLGNILAQANGSLETRWYNLYGAHEFKNDKLLGNVAKVGGAVIDTVKSAVVTEMDYETLYNNCPDKGPAFKGRALLKFRVTSKRPAKYDTPAMIPFKLKIKERPKEPPSTDYILKAFVVVGNQLPRFTDMGAKGALTAGMAKQELRVKICLGAIELTTKPAKYEEGTCKWNDLLRSEPMKLPIDLSQIPDFIMYLLKSDGKPVCFSRFKLVDLKEDRTIGFNQPPVWYLLQEDKVIDALYDGDFPGSVLMKLGFGRADQDDAATVIEWSKAMEGAKTGSLHQVRVHLYQARDIPAVDSNGLCDPYVKINFMGHKHKSTVKKKTLYPEYFETFIFDDVMIPEAENFLFAPQISFRVFDEDIFGADDYIGTCSFNLSDAVKTEDPETEMPDPIWLSLFKEIPNDAQGQILIQVQVIPVLAHNKAALAKPAGSIIPDHVDAFIEVIAVGIRDMLPFNFMSMQSPFLEFELNSLGNKYIQTTEPSKRPFPDNPNFLNTLIMPCRLPLKSIYATPLQLRARDMRLGGFQKPVVGVGAVDLTRKLPWCLDTYIKPQTDIFKKTDTDLLLTVGINADGDDENAMDAVGMETMLLQNERIEQLADDDYIAMQEPANVDQLLKKRAVDIDTGAGVFGALNHITLDGKKKKKAENIFTDPDWSQDDSDSPPDWIVNRKLLESELEEEFKTTPFETYALTRGQMNGVMGSTLKIVGRFKGLIRVITDRDEPPLFDQVLLDNLFKPKGYKIRLYVLKASNLTPMDKDMFGRPAKSDPYLIVSLGKETINDRKNANDDVTDVDLYKLIEFNAELPGSSWLNIKVMDKNDFNSDGLIGQTGIDLEDRWFDSRWQEWGEENKVLPGDTEGAAGRKPRWQTKPIERRNLYELKAGGGSSAFGSPQGVLECWVDIMTPEVAAAFEPDNVSLPPIQIFEVRVIVWKSKNVPAMDSLENMSDLYVKCWPEGCTPQDTDTHWRCKRGKASWNYRLNFDVELGHSTKAMKFPYLHFQLWDSDLLKWNDCAGEATVNLGKYYRKAYKRGVVLKLFESKKGAAAKREKKRQEGKIVVKAPVEILDDGEDIPPEEGEEEEKKEDSNLLMKSRKSLKNSSSINNNTNNNGNNTLKKSVTKDNNGDYNAMTDTVANPLIGNNNMVNVAIDSDDDDSDDEDDDDDGVQGGGHNHSATQQHGGDGKVGVAAKIQGKGNTKIIETGKMASGSKVKKDIEKKEKEPKQWYEFWKSDDETADQEKDEAEEPLLNEEVEKTEEEKRKEEDDEEVNTLVTTIKNMTGLWDILPDDSAWLNFESRDHNTGKVTPMGSIAYSVQIWPKDKAILFNVGSARSEPNTNPFLPPPVGRLKFSLNPFVMGSALCGPKLCAVFFCCFLCAVFIVLMIFCQPFLNIIINLIFIG